MSALRGRGSLYLRLPLRRTRPANLKFSTGRAHWQPEDRAGGGGWAGPGRN